MAAGATGASSKAGGGRNKIPSILVHCVFISSSSAALACALIALGTACHVIGSNPESGPCPNYLQSLVFGVAGVLLVLSLILFNWVLRSRKRKLGNRALEEFISSTTIGNNAEMVRSSNDIVASGGHQNADGQHNHGENGGKSLVDNSLSYDNVEDADAVLEEMERIIQEEKSAEVSYWIQHQGAQSYELPPPPPPEECLKPAETEDDRNSNRSENTAL